MELRELLKDAVSHMAETGHTDGLQSCGVRHLAVAQTRQANVSSCSVVEPLVGLVLQGSKSVQYGTEHVRYAAGDVIAIGHALPMVSGRVTAQPDAPFVALYVRVDMQVIRGVYSDMGGLPSDETGPALATGAAGPDIVDAFARLFRLRHDPIEEQTLGHAALREVYFRVLRSDKGHALRRTLQANSKANQVARAIAYIRKEYRSTIKASELADISGMSASVFYDAFKRITANSPLQFQKDLRLTEAHHLLQQTSAPISEIAHSVGYESAAQFSREFSKKFGAPPRAFVNGSAA